MPDQIPRDVVSDYGSSAMTPCAEASGESRSRTVKNGIPRARVPPSCGAVATKDRQENLTKEINQ